MILVEESVARLGQALNPYGGSIRRWSRRAAKRRDLELATLEDLVKPLHLPVELRAFWQRWDAGSMRTPCFDGFFGIDAVARARLDLCPPLAEVLLPIASYDEGVVLIELETTLHPGGRVFFAPANQSHIELWTFGLSALFDLLSEALEQDAIDDVDGSLAWHPYKRLVRAALISESIDTSSLRFAAYDRSRMPEHWQAAEGISPTDFALVGATHSVEELLYAREHGSEVFKVTLAGNYCDVVAGGPLHGCVGVFEDNTGAVQVFIPDEAALRGALGDAGGVEIDAIVLPKNGADIGVLSAREELQVAAHAGRLGASRHLVDRLFNEMHFLDTSVIVTALRPIHEEQ